MNARSFRLSAGTENALWRLGRGLLHAVGLFWQIFMIAPILIVVVVSFTSASFLMFPPPGFSGRWYENVLGLSWFQSSLVSSLLIAVSATAIAVALGVLVARALARARFPGQASIEYIVLSPLFLPGVVIGFSIFNLMVILHVDRIGQAEMVMAHVLITLPFVVRSVWAAMAGSDISLEEAAQSLGANPVQVFFHVVLRSAVPGILAGTILAFTYSFNDVTISIFLTSSRVTTLPVELMSHIEYSPDPSPAAISSLMILLMLVLFLVLGRIGGLNAFLDR